MLKNLISVGIFAGVAASVPIAYQTNPEAFHSLFSDTQNAENMPQVSSLEPVRKRNTAVTGPLSGRSHTVSMDQQGHFRDHFKLNGRNVTALVDTGATLVAINKSTARRIGLNLSSTDFIYEVNTANGVTRAASVVIDRLKVGRIEMDKVKAVVLEDKALQGTLIGMSFLKRLDSFSVKGNKLHLEQ